MNDSPAIAAFIFENLSDLMEARQWRIQIGWSYIEQDQQQLYVRRIVSDRRFDLADPECHQKIKDYLLEREDFVMFEFPGKSRDPLKGAIRRSKLNEIILGDIDWGDKINAIFDECLYCEFPVNSDWMLDHGDKCLWDDFISDYDAWS